MEKVKTLGKSTLLDDWLWLEWEKRKKSLDGSYIQAADYIQSVFFPSLGESCSYVYIHVWISEISVFIPRDQAILILWFVNLGKCDF